MFANNFSLVICNSKMNVRSSHLTPCFLIPDPSEKLGQLLLECCSQWGIHYLSSSTRIVPILALVRAEGRLLLSGKHVCEKTEEGSDTGQGSGKKILHSPADLGSNFRSCC